MFRCFFFTFESGYFSQGIENSPILSTNSQNTSDEHFRMEQNPKPTFN